MSVLDSMCTRTQQPSGFTSQQQREWANAPDTLALTFAILLKLVLVEDLVA